MARLTGKNNTNGLDKNPQNINRDGRPLSFKKRFQELYGEGSDGVIWIDAEKVAKRVKDGRTEYGLPLTKRDSILAKLDRLLMSNKEAISLDAIKFIWNQIDGTAKQTVEHSGTDGAPIEYRSILMPENPLLTDQTPE